MNRTVSGETYRRRDSILLTAVAALLVHVGCASLVDPPTRGGDATILDFAALTFAEGRYVAVGNTFDARDGAVLPESDEVTVWTSSDGRLWRDVSPEAAGTLFGVTYGGGLFVAVGHRLAHGPGPQTTESVLVTSPDGETWTRQSVPSLRLRSVAFGNGRFVAAGLDPATLSGEVMVSDDASTWRSVGVVSPGFELAFGGGLFVSWGESNAVGISSNGEDWTVETTGPVNIIRDIGFLDGRFVGMGDYDCCFGEVPGARQHYRLESADGVSWTARPQALEKVFFDHAFGAGRYVAAGGAEIGVSADALTWSVATSVPDFVGDVAFGDAGFVAVGRSAWLSPDGLEWERVQIGPR